MNTSGIIRGYMSKNMRDEEFMAVVRKALSKEFEEEVILKVYADKFKIKIRNFNVKISKDHFKKIKSPYSIDKYILEELSKQGFNFDKHRSQYIRCCYGNYDTVN